MQNELVSNEEWLEARLKLLAKEKEFSRQRDELTEMRRQLPWRKLAKDYSFQSEAGEVSLADLFDGCSQLIVYHFMYGPNWSEGCKICSMFGDHYDPLVVHLRARDVSLVTVSRAPLETLLAYRQRMAWSFRWVSSLESDFNWDFDVSFRPEAMASGKIRYNYRDDARFPVDEGPGISSFFKSGNNVFHTYSSFGRGLENFLGIYNFLDIVPKGRDEDELPYGMAWVRHKDRYDGETVEDPYV